MPPTSPPITAAPFHIASVTVRPKPSRVDLDDRGSALQRVHQGWIIDRKNDNAFVGNVLDRLEDFPAFRIIGGVVADENEGTVRQLPRLSESLDDAHGVFPSV